jgi:hypothetical protein
MNGSFLKSYDEDQIASVIAKALTEKPFEGAARCAAFRCHDKKVFDRLLGAIGGADMQRILQKVKALVASDKKAQKILSKSFVYSYDPSAYTLHCFFD